MSGPIKLEVNHVEMLGDNGMEWGLSTEDVLGGSGRATLVVQDRTFSWEPQDHWDVKCSIRSTGWVLFRGELNVHGTELEVGVDFRRWSLDCVDYNSELRQRKVGALDGKTWIDTSGLGVYINIDPYATSLGTDKLTVQQLFDHYVRVDGQAFETETFVQQYIDELFPTTWDYGDVEQALTDMAALIVENLQFWGDPDLYFHWVTIPAWQDLSGDLPIIPGMELAPLNLSDAPVDDSEVGTGKITISFDGSEMPEQVYVRGGTGYVYNDAAIPQPSEDKTVVVAPVYGTDATYELTFLATTKLWHTDSTGYISTTYDTCGASGPYEVRYIKVPWSATRNKGGMFWKLLEGPDAGKLVDNDTNVLSGYGQIEVVMLAGAPSGPVVGVGGSGWVGEVTQDPNKRQVYLEAPISTTVAIRDQFGGQALYRGQYATLRGTVVVHAEGADGWRAGQLVKITDARLPSSLSGRYFVIQRVSTSLIEGSDIREYKLDFGDGPTGRYSAQPQGGGDVQWPPPFNQIDVQAFDLTPGPNSTQRIVGQLINGSGGPWAIEGKVVNWSFECYNSGGVKQTGQGSISPTVSITDKYGKAYTKLTTGPATGMVYYVFAKVKAV